MSQGIDWVVERLRIWNIASSTVNISTSSTFHLAWTVSNGLPIRISTSRVFMIFVSLAEVRGFWCDLFCLIEFWLRCEGLELRVKNALFVHNLVLHSNERHHADIHRHKIPLKISLGKYRCLKQYSNTYVVYMDGIAWKMLKCKRLDPRKA